ncbi:conjugal transfer protein TrbL family protein, partial [Paenibacillus larvae]
IIASLILSIMGAIRYAELAMVFVLSPVVLSGNVTGDNLKSLLLNATGIIFTQSAQVAALSLLFSNMVNGDATRMLFAIGIIVLLLRGSKILTNFLYSTGTGSAATTAMGASVRMMAARNIGGRAVRALKAV